MTPRSADARDRDEAELEQAIDSVLAASFPASDPPQWDSLATRSRAIDHSTTGSGSPLHTRIASKT